ncbi:hypothetical protein J7K50_06900 [bacterium]|nr:hypothetical protein [bacterium]
MESPNNSAQEPGKPVSTPVVIIFWVQLALFVLIAFLIIAGPEGPIGRSPFIYAFFISIALFFLLGVAMIFLAVKWKVKGLLRKFLILTGISSTGIPVCIILHNVVYGLFIWIFGKGFWGGNNGGGDEPVFFLLALIVFPISFLVGVVGSIVMLIKRRRRTSE